MGPGRRVHSVAVPEHDAAADLPDPPAGARGRRFRPRLLGGLPGRDGRRRHGPRRSRRVCHGSLPRDDLRVTDRTCRRCVLRSRSLARVATVGDMPETGLIEVVRDRSDSLARFAEPCAAVLGPELTAYVAGADSVAEFDAWLDGTDDVARSRAVVRLAAAFEV